jgi:hypothetical protein
VGARIILLDFIVCELKSKVFLYANKPTQKVLKKPMQNIRTRTGRKTPEIWRITSKTTIEKEIYKQAAKQHT